MRTHLFLQDDHMLLFLFVLWRMRLRCLMAASEHWFGKGHEKAPVT